MSVTHSLCNKDKRRIGKKETWLRILGNEAGGGINQEVEREREAERKQFLIPSS